MERTRDNLVAGRLKSEVKTGLPHDDHYRMDNINLSL